MTLVLRVCLAVTLALGSVLGVAVAPCWACSCVEARPTELVGRADAIFVATVTSIEPPADQSSSGALRSYVTRVSSVYKGEVPTTVRVRSAVSGASCGLEGITTEGTYLFYVRGGPGAWTSGLCDGTTPAVDEESAVVESLLGKPHAPVATAAPDGPASASPEHASAGRSGLNAAEIGAGFVGVVGLIAFVLWRRRSLT